MKRHMSLLLIIAVIIVTLAGCHVSSDEGQNTEPDFLEYQHQKNDLNAVEYVTYSENEQLILEMNPDTAVFRITVKETGRVWYSGDIAQGNMEQISFSYVDSTGSAHIMSTYDDAVAKGQYEISPISDGFKIRYSLGDLGNNLLCPTLISVEHYEFVEGALGTRDRQVLNSLYYLVDIQNQGVEDQAELVEKYPILAQKACYLLRNTTLSGNNQSKLDDLLRKAGYSQEMLEEDEGLYESASSSNIPRYDMTVYYTLHEGELRVRIPETELFMYENMPIENVNVLPYFGQPELATTGYYVLPDGSGSIMNFYNGKGGKQPYQVMVYGNNESLSNGERVLDVPQAYLPLYGCNQGNDGFLAVISEGETFAEIIADPGTDAQKASAYCAFRVNEKLNMDTITSNADVNTKQYFVLYQSQRYEGDMVVSYHFLTGDETTYSGMASYYQNLLFGDADVSEKVGDQVPLVTEIVGVADISSNVLGVSYQKDILLTSYDQMQNIAETLLDNGCTNLSVRLVGYLNGGYHQHFLKNAKLHSLAGTEEEFARVIDELTEKGVRIYLDGDVQYAYDGGWFDGFNKSKDAIRYLSKDIGVAYPYDLATFQPNAKDSPMYILNDIAVKKGVEQLKTIADTYGKIGLSLRSIGSKIHANYNEKMFLERQNTMNRLLSYVSELEKCSQGLLLSGGIAPFVEYATTIVELPLSSAQYDITDYSIPFLAMVYSGYVNYTGDCVNQEYGNENDYLRLIENGAGLYYRVCDSDGQELLNGEYDNWYAIGFDSQQEKIVDRYQKLSKALQGCVGTPLTDHRRIEENVFASTFANGTTIYVNYNNYAVVLEDGTEISAHSYHREEQTQ